MASSASFSGPFIFNADWLKLVLEPLAGFCVRHCLCIQDVGAFIKEALVRAAVKELTENGHKASVSRVSVATGVHRREVKKILAAGARTQPEEAEPSVSLLSKIIGRWGTDRRYLTSSLKPRVLGLGSGGNGFAALVREVDTNYNPRTVLLELKRIGAVVETPKGVKLLQSVARFDKDYRRGCQILGQNIETLIKTVEENLLGVNAIRNLHITTEYDNIAQQDLEALRTWLLEEGAAFHKRAREFLSQFDMDVNPTAGKQGGVNVKVAAFSLVTRPSNISGKPK